jgi:hypothetical protein
VDDSLDETLAQRRDALHIVCSSAAVCRTLHKLDLTRKKSVHAAQRQRTAV